MNRAPRVLAVTTLARLRRASPAARERQHGTVVLCTVASRPCVRRACLIVAAVAVALSGCVVVRTHGEGIVERDDRAVTIRRPAAHASGASTSADDTAAPIPRTTGFAAAADGTRIYYEKLGSGPAIAFVHGLGGNHAVWFRQVPLFARDHTVVVLSQRGFAPSEGPRDRFDVDVLVDDFVRVLDAAGVRRAHVVGQSMGGWTALGVALAHPERVESVVLADTIGGIFDDEIRAHYATTVERARSLGASPPPLGRHPALGEEFSREHPDEAYLYQLLATFGSPSPGVIAQQLGATAFPHDALAKLSMPVLFVVGDRDAIFPPELIRRAAAYVPAARVATIPAAGHSPYFESPDEWHGAVHRFVTALAGR